MSAEFCICIKNVPSEFDDSSLKGLCSNYGNVTRISGGNNKTPYRFVSFETHNEMARALTAINRDKVYGLKADVAKRKYNLESPPVRNNITTNNNMDSEEDKKIDLSKRCFGNLLTKPPECRFPDAQEDFVTEEIYEETKLKEVDPARNFLVKKDVHYEDRNNSPNTNRSGRLMHTGRAYYVESEEVTNKAKRLTESSIGKCDLEGAYTKLTEKKDKGNTPNKCVRCGKGCHYACPLCNTKYCSRKCQSMDWLNHRSICSLNYRGNCENRNEKIADKVGKSIDKENFSKNKISDESNPEKGSYIKPDRDPKNRRFRVTSIYRENIIYIRSTESQDETEYKELSNLIIDKSKNAKPLNTMPKKGDLCISKCGTIISRVIVLDALNETSINVMHIDIGIIGTKKLSDLIESTPEVIDKERFAVPVCLKGVPALERLPEGMNYIKSLIKAGIIVKVKNVESNNDRDFVELINDANNESINEKILKLCNLGKIVNPISTAQKSVTHLSSPNSKKKSEKIFEDFFSMDLPKSESHVIITSVVSSQKVFITSGKTQDTIEYQNLIAAINKIGINAKPLKMMPKKGDLCITIFEEMYFRAMVMDTLNEDEISVLFVEFGNTDNKKLSELKEIPSEYGDKKSYIVPVYLKGVPAFELSSEGQDYMNYLIDNDITMKIIYEDLNNDGEVFVELINDTNNESINEEILKFRNEEIPVAQKLVIPSKDYSSNQITPPVELKNEMQLMENKSRKANTVDYPKSGSHVRMSAFISTDKCFVRSAASKDFAEYCYLLREIDNAAQTAKPLQRMPNIGDLCIANFKGMRFYRALVLNLCGKDKILVSYVDFGNVEEKKLLELREIPTNLTDIKYQAIQIRLNGVPDFWPTPALNEYMSSLVDNYSIDLKIVYEKKEDDESPSVELFNVTYNESVNERILDYKDIKTKDSDEPVYDSAMEYTILPIGQNINVFIMDNSFVHLGFITCILEKNIPLLKKFHDQLKAYAEKTSGPYTPRPRELCVVQSTDGQWYRGVCLEVLGDGNPSIQFVDVGIVAAIHIDKMRKYPRELIQPCVTSECTIEGLPEKMSEAAAARVRELIPINEKYVVDKISTVSEDGLERNKIYMPKLIEILQSEGLI